jgi:hypothetical protein
VHGPPGRRGRTPPRWRPPTRRSAGTRSLTLTLRPARAAYHSHGCRGCRRASRSLSLRIRQAAGWTLSRVNQIPCSTMASYACTNRIAPTPSWRERRAAIASAGDHPSGGSWDAARGTPHTEPAPARSILMLRVWWRVHGAQMARAGGARAVHRELQVGRGGRARLSEAAHAGACRQSPSAGWTQPCCHLSLQERAGCSCTISAEGTSCSLRHVYVGSKIAGVVVRWVQMSALYSVRISTGTGDEVGDEVEGGG